MRAYHLKSNYANLTNEVKSDYPFWVDRFNRVLCACLLIMEYQGVIAFQHIQLENTQYNDLYQRARQTPYIRSALETVGVMTDYEITLTTDLLPMVEEFLKLKYVITRQNYLMMYIDHLVNVNVRLTSIPFNHPGVCNG